MKSKLIPCLILALSLSACGQGPPNNPSVTATVPAKSQSASLDFSKGSASDQLPTVSYISKSSFLFGDAVFITGTNLLSTSSISYRGQVINFLVGNDTTLVTDLPENANLAEIIITNQYGSNAPAVVPDDLSLSTYSGGIGTTVVITGTGLTGASAVDFNGTAASFTVNSNTQITATVPIGASDGIVSVSPASGDTLTSATFDVSNKIVFVDSSRLNPDAVSDGSTWSKAYTDLQSALTAATAGDEIWIAEGSYKPTSGSDRKLSFSLDKQISVYGGFAGNESQLSARNWQSHPTILSGDLSGDDTSNFGNLNDNSYHVVTVKSAATLDGFQIQSGYSQYVSPADTGLVEMQGGGLYCLNASPTLKNLVFSGNASDKGGAMAISGTSTASLSQVAFSKNVASYGGGLYVNAGAAVSLSNSVFSGNVGSNGGGMYVSSANANLNHVTFVSNHAAENNLAFAADAPASVTLRNTLLWDNLPETTVGSFTQSSTVTAMADPFTQSSDPDGPDNFWFSSDDGLQLKPSLSEVINLGLSTDLTSDSLGRSRLGSPDPGAYEAQ